MSEPVVLTEPASVDDPLPLLVPLVPLDPLPLVPLDPLRAAPFPELAPASSFPVERRL